MAVGGGGEVGDKDRVNGTFTGMLYKAIFQSVLLYVIDSWVVAAAMLKLLEGFHHRSFRRIMGMTA